MNHIITNWENDLIDEPENIVTAFVKDKYKDYDFKLLSGLAHRDKQDLYDSLRESRVIIMQPSLLEPDQIAEIATLIGHPIHVTFNSAAPDWNIKDFVFLSSNPFDDLNIVKDACKDVKDEHHELALVKILHNCECHFYGFAGEHYEMKCSGSVNYDIYAIRYN